MPSLYAPERILLEQEQKDLFRTLIEADNSVPRSKRRKLQVWTSRGNDEVHTGVRHPGLRNILRVFQGDIDAFVRAGLLEDSYESPDLTEYTITPLGREYYRHLIEQTAEPTQRTEERVRHYLDADLFRRTYPVVHQKWAKAEALLWGDDSGEHLSTIGHLCREAVQEFAEGLILHYVPENTGSKKEDTKRRMMLVLQARSADLGQTEGAFLESLHTYWCNLIDLVQRQEHAGQREKEPLTWDDARRVVFQSIIVMFEIDRSLSRRQ